MQTKFDTVVQVVMACSTGETPRVSAECEATNGYAWTIRISGQTVVYKGKTLDEACGSLLANWEGMASARIDVLQRMTKWLIDAYDVEQRSAK